MIIAIAAAVVVVLLVPVLFVAAAAGTVFGTGGVGPGSPAGVESAAPTAGYSAILCPVVGPTTFTDTWLAPRSGGRRHKGVDIFAPAGAEVVAPVAGTVRYDNDRLGGLAFTLWGDDGTYFYGAHLLRFGPLAGRVDAGAPLGAVGTTGNAVGTPPHLHFEIHPDRRPGEPARPVNPTPATKAACG